MKTVIIHDRIKKILIIQIRPFGDVLLSTSYLSILRKKYPDAEISFFVSEPYDTILENNPNINKVIVTARKGTFRYYTNRLYHLIKFIFSTYDLVIDQQGNAGSRTIALITRAPYKLGWENIRSSFLYNIKASVVKERYAGSQNFDMLIPLGIKEEPIDYCFHIKEKSFQKIDSFIEENNIETDRLIIIAPGSVASYKQWNTLYFANVADMILEHYNVQMVISWAPVEYGTAKRMLQLMKSHVSLSPETTFNEIAALLSRAKFLLCNDCALNHLSVITKTASLAIFGKTDPAHWSAQGFVSNHYHIWKGSKRDTENNTFGITPDEVYNKVEEIFGGLSLLRFKTDL